VRRRSAGSTASDTRRPQEIRRDSGGNARGGKRDQDGGDFRDGLQNSATQALAADRAATGAMLHRAGTRASVEARAARCRRFLPGAETPMNTQA
jgi:hypothetical protein